MKTLNPRPGKYEGNYSQMVARAAHQASLDGADICGNVQEYGWFASLVRGKRYTFIVAEDNYGFVDVEVFKNGDRAIETNWNAYLQMVEDADSDYQD